MGFIKDLPEVHFGKIVADVDWRKDDTKENDDDDQALSDEVIAMLGFDPSQLKEEK